ncbi:nitrate regulatory gene2 protein-like [Cynara cardunculus var. scolymus]|uniref:nitrate regulatory gene2 protein-like n=1 Tax=Cynara cardunculus var. scolymus TaxID=59895 RepID=UPI000D62480D|nr:nitrate regulatory gene2 protein-like [Cynara cardunculus var. scolymus]
MTSPSCRSLLSNSSRSSSSMTGFNSNADLFDEAGGMESGSHLSTLGRLFAWEKKLYDEVKAGNEMKKIYDRKSSQLSTENATNKQGIEDQVNDLYSRLMVSIKICDSISKRIEKVRDDELQPQLIELLHGLTKTWKVMLESHKTQSRTMFEVRTFPSAAALTSDRSRHLATLQLEAEIQNWRMCFSSYIAATESYIEALSEWAYRTIAPENEGSPPLVFALCRDWLTVTKNLPDKAVTYAMKRFAKDLRTLWAQQGIEQQQKRKVDRLVAESEKRVVGFEREERNIVSSKPMNMKNKVDVLAEKKAQLDGFTKMVETEKAKHKDYVEETCRVILVGFQTGFSSVFDSLTQFSEVCVRKYDDVVQNATSGPNPVLGC